MIAARALLLAILLAAPVAAATVTEIRVHGNRKISDADVTACTAVAVGDSIDQTGLAAMQLRLLECGRFVSGEVRIRYRSLSQTDDVALLIAVVEKPRLVDKLQLLPVVGHDDALGFRLGAQIAASDALGVGERFAVFASALDVREARLEVGTAGDTETAFSFAAGVRRYLEPHRDDVDRRSVIEVAARQRLGGPFTANLSLAFQDATRGVESDQFGVSELSLNLDTRSDLGFPRDGIFARLAWRGYHDLLASGRRDRLLFEVRGYHGAVGPAVLTARGFFAGGDALPDLERPWVGGEDSLRGHRPGERRGDHVAGARLELRWPLTSPVGLGRAGLAVFFDTAAAWSSPSSLGQARFGHGAGIGLFADATLARVRLDLASDLNGGLRVHLQSGFQF